MTGRRNSSRPTTRRPQEERVFHEVLPARPEAQCMIEAGGYWAYYSMWAKLVRPRARTLIIEPVDSHLAVGEANLALNGMTAEFGRASVGAESRPAADLMLEGVRVPALEQMSIDDVVGRLGIPFVHVLHADVQGAELDLIRGTAIAKVVGFPGPDRVAISRNTRRASPEVVLGYGLRRLGLGGRRAG